LETEPISTNSFYKQKLRLKDDEPVYIKNYRSPHSQVNEIQKHVGKLFTDGIVEPYVSEYTIIAHYYMFLKNDLQVQNKRNGD